jgi:drug/metabolite transporter (DMT)-like permease
LNNSHETSGLRRWLPLLALISLTLLWGCTWVIAKQGLSYSPPFSFAAQRCVGGALALWLVLKLSGRPIKLVAPGPTIAIALSQVTGFMLFQSWALMEGGAGKTAVLIFTMPIWTLIMSWPILGERIRGSQWLAAASTLGGLMLIIEPWNMHSDLFGKFLGVMAALSWAVGTILIKRYRAQLPTDLLALTFWQMLLGAIPLTILAVLVPERATQWAPQFISILAFVSVVSLAGCWLLWLYILNRLPAWEASLSVLGTPVVAILSSRLMMGEAFKPTEIAGIVLIATGLALLSLVGWLSSRRAYDLLNK